MQYISVAIPTYNSAKSIRACLDSILSQDYPKDYFKILVVDCGNDETDQICWSLGVECHRLPVRVPTGAARNIMTGLAKGEIVAFIDSDCVAPKDWIAKIVNDFQDFPQAVGVLGTYTGSRSILDRIWGGELMPNRRETGLFSGFVEGNAAFKRSVFEDGIRFSDVHGGECISLMSTLRKRNLVTLWDTSLKVLHNGKMTFNKMFQIDRQYCRLTLRSGGKSLLLGLFKLLLLVAIVLGPIFFHLIGFIPAVILLAITLWYSLTDEKLSLKYRLYYLPILIFMKLILWGACILETLNILKVS